VPNGVGDGVGQNQTDARGEGLNRKFFRCFQANVDLRVQTARIRDSAIGNFHEIDVGTILGIGHFTQGECLQIGQGALDLALRFQ